MNTNLSTPAFRRHSFVEARCPKRPQWLSVFGLSIVWLLISLAAQAQLTPSQDAYTDTAHPTTNYGTAATLGVANGNLSIQTSYIQFDLSAIPTGYSGSNIAKATLRIYVDGATKAGSFNVDFVNGAWTESTITANSAPALGNTIAASVSIATTNKNDYISIDITTALQAWLNGSQANDGIALVANSPLAMTIDSTKNTKTSHSPQVDVVFASGQGTITGVNTASGSGLQGGGTSGTLNLSLISTCASGQVLSWNGSAWVCTTVKGTGTVTSVGSGLGLTGGPITTNGTLSIDATTVPLLASANNFTIGQTISNSLSNADALDVLTSGAGHAGVLAINTATSGGAVGVVGATEDAAGYGVYGSDSASGGTGVYGTTSGGYAVHGVDSSSGFGVFGQGNAGVVGIGFIGVDGSSATGYGVNSSGQWGILAESNACCSGYGGEFYGYRASSGSGNNGTAGISSFGGNGDSSTFLANGGDGIEGNGGSANSFPGAGGTFVGGTTIGSGLGGDGIFAQGGTGVSGSGYAGVFEGDVIVNGAISAGTKDFKIDHPLDPASKYLVHASVESSEMMNIYTGNVTTNTQGLATVKLPEWFEALNTDFRYQLTVIGTFAQAIVASKIHDHQFTIKTNAPNVEVSWQVTGVRQDAFAKAHPLVVEEEKDPRSKGFYLHPELYGAPDEKRIEWARHPGMMKRMEERREAPRRPAAIPALPAAKPAPGLPAAAQRILGKKQ